MTNFERWLFEGKYTPTGVTFDVGGTCRSAIFNHEEGNDALSCGLSSEYSNGNGSLMRIHPFVLYSYCNGLSLEECLKIVECGSLLTHAHHRSVLGCCIYACVVYKLLEVGKMSAIFQGLAQAKRLFEAHAELCHYSRVFDEDFASISREKSKAPDTSSTRLKRLFGA